tara:strand:- start:365 stop:703 length:339 start_codon:yes stop_codon:yes gene_type:complete
MYEIKNLNKFAKRIGLEVAKDAGFKKKQLTEWISVKSIKEIIKENASRKLGSDSLYVSRRQAENICEDIFGWLAGMNLAKLAADDILDCWWDDEKDCMVFQKKDIGDEDEMA